MTCDFFISLCLATHRVGNLLNTEVGTPIKLCANAVLSRLILVLEGSLSPSQKKTFAEDVLKELQSLAQHFELAKAQGNINPANFSILEGEYAKVREFAQGFLSEREQGEGNLKEVEGRLKEEGERRLEEKEGRLREGEGPPALEEGKLLRARKILGLLGSKEKVQVWELKKVLPQVTKRTLRRDLDALVQKGLLERKGEWNTVYYQVKTAD